MSHSASIASMKNWVPISKILLFPFFVFFNCVSLKLKWIFKKWDRGTDWIELAQDTDRRRALVNAVINRQVS
jgi:hypothetical protein